MYGVTRRLPDFEKFDSQSQIRRAAVSLTNNMAEGSRTVSLTPDQVRFILQLARFAARTAWTTSTSAMTKSIIRDGDKVAEAERAKPGRAVGLINGYLHYLRDRRDG